MIFYKPGDTKSREGSRWPGMTRWLALGMGLVMIWSLIEGVVQIRKGYWRLSQAEAELKVKQQEREELLAKKEEVQSGEYVERVIRDDLRMQKEGEVVIVLPKGDMEESKKADETGKEVNGKDIRENWQKWWDLLK